MASPPDSPIEEVIYELEPTRVPKPITVALEDLCRQTKFTRQEIRVMYRGFKTECPEGVVHEDCFKDIYAKFFPHGNSSLYAHYVFKAFDVNCNGAISFRDLLVTLSTLLRGSVYERLRWTFKLYDLNGDGCISRNELGDVVMAIHELMGRRAHQPEDDRKARDQLNDSMQMTYSYMKGILCILMTSFILLPDFLYSYMHMLTLDRVDGSKGAKEHPSCTEIYTWKDLYDENVDRVFRKLDLNQDGVITIEEFLEACLKDDLVTRSLQMFDTEL